MGTGPARREIWVDAQLPPATCRWLASPEAELRHVAELGLLTARDPAIFAAARERAAAVLTKDQDFVQLLERHGPPPAVVWVTVGNLTNAGLRELLVTHWPRVLALLAAGEHLIEIAGPREAAS